jgi:hypothetical protein
VATGAVGAALPGISLAITGVSATGAAGTVSILGGVMKVVHKVSLGPLRHEVLMDKVKSSVSVGPVRTKTRMEGTAS